MDEVCNMRPDAAAWARALLWLPRLRCRALWEGARRDGTEAKCSEVEVRAAPCSDAQAAACVVPAGVGLALVSGAERRCRLQWLLEMAAEQGRREELCVRPAVGCPRGPVFPVLGCLP